MSNTEQTLSIIKPDAVERNLAEEIKKEFRSNGFNISNEKKIKLEKNEISLIDIRDIRELWKEGTIENAQHIPRGMLEFWLDPESAYFKSNKIKDMKKMVLFCALGFRSALATKTLKDMGFENVANVEGGFEALKKSGLNIVTKEKK